MVNFNDLPQFLKDRISLMPKEVQKPFLHSIDDSWVKCQSAAYEITKGLEEGKWTIEDLRNYVKSQQANQT